MQCRVRFALLCLQCITHFIRSMAYVFFFFFFFFRCSVSLLTFSSVGWLVDGRHQLTNILLCASRSQYFSFGVLIRIRCVFFSLSHSCVRLRSFSVFASTSFRCAVRHIQFSWRFVRSFGSFVRWFIRMLTIKLLLFYFFLFFFYSLLTSTLVCYIFLWLLLFGFMCLPSSIHLLSCVYMSLCFVHTVHTVCMLYTFIFLFLGIPHCLSVRCNAF